MAPGRPSGGLWRACGAILGTRGPPEGLPSSEKIDLAPLGGAWKRKVDRFRPSGGSPEASRRVPGRLLGGLLEGACAEDDRRSKFL